MADLGFGLMRLPKKADGQIDVDEFKQMVDAFLGAGFTYFDTAFVYGGSEAATKEALVDRYPRDAYQLTTKLFGSSCKTKQDVIDQFETSLERTGAGYFDNYLMHNLGESRTRPFIDLDIYDYLCEQKAAGRIRHIGFSMHDTADVLDELLGIYPDVDFVQLQINYMDWDDEIYQSRKCYEVARRHHKPIIVMEPIKGGNLAVVPKAVEDIFKSADPEASPAEWALRFVAGLEGVEHILSGMSSLEQMKANIETFKDIRPLSNIEITVLRAARDEFRKLRGVDCTACGYCIPGCPQNIPIFKIFKDFNIAKMFGRLDLAKQDYGWETGYPGRGKASDCIACGKCEEVCTQHLPIIRLLRESAEMFE